MNMLKLSTLMSATVDILCFISTYITPDNQLLEIKYAFNLKPLIYFETQITQITQIFSHLKLWIAVARHNFNG